MFRSSLVWVLALAALAGCRTDFQEVHLYRVVPQAGELPNYYRLRITGDATFSQAKYISGCYDERAIDIVFDEISSSSSSGTVKFLSGGETELGDQKVTTVEVEEEACPPGKSKLMIFSTNAKVITDTIGEFAENQVVAESIVGLMEHDDLEDATERLLELKEVSNTQLSASSEVQAMVTALPSGDDPDQVETEAGVLRLLNAIARAQGRFQPLRNIDEARAWFEARQAAREAKR